MSSPPGDAADVTHGPRPRVVVVGSLNRDYVCTVDRLPSEGETVLGSELALHDGGKGGNQAVAAALVGAVTGAGCALVGAVGADPDGRALLAGLGSAGVDTSAVTELADVRTGAALITVDGSGANTIVVAPGANHGLDQATVAAALDTLLADRGGDGTVVVLQGELTGAVTESALRRAADAGARVVLNLAPVRPVPEDLLALCDPLVVNETEAAALVGGEIGADAGRAAHELGSRARSVVVTAGAAGVVVVVDGDTTRVPAPVTEVVDSTGAGDAFTGALAVGLAHGRGLVAAARWGVAVASYSVAHGGAQASYPRDEACAALLRHGDS